MSNNVQCIEQISNQSQERNRKSGDLQTTLGGFGSQAYEDTANVLLQNEVQGLDQIVNLRQGEAGNISDYLASLDNNLAEQNSIPSDSAPLILMNIGNNAANTVGGNNVNVDDNSKLIEDSDDSLVDRDYENVSGESGNSEPNLEDIYPPKRNKRRSRPETWQRNMRKKNVLGGTKHKYKAKIMKAGLRKGSG